MQGTNPKIYTLEVLQEKDIDECAELIGNAFVNVCDSLLYYLEYKPNDLKEKAKITLSKIVHDKLSVVAKDSNGKIIGCCAGMILSKIKSLGSNSFNKRENLTFNIDLKKMPHQEKILLLEELEYIFLKDHYEKLLTNKYEDFAVLGRYFCVSVEYFGSNLAKNIILFYGKNCADRGIKHSYSIVFNSKVVTMFTKHLPQTITNQYAITLYNNGKKNELDAYLFHYSYDIPIAKPNF